MRFAVVLFLLAFAPRAHAILTFALDTSIVQDTKTITDSPTVSESFYDGSIGVQLWKDSRLFMTLGYLYSSSKEPLSTSTSATFVSNNPYGGLKVLLGAKNNWAVGAYWVPYLQGSYAQSGSSTEVWSGTGYYAKITAQPELATWFRLNLSLAYYGGSYTSKGSSNSVSTVDSFARAVVIPLIGFQILY